MLFQNSDYHITITLHLHIIHTTAIANAIKFVANLYDDDDESSVDDDDGDGCGGCDVLVVLVAAVTGPSIQLWPSTSGVDVASMNAVVISLLKLKKSMTG